MNFGSLEAFMLQFFWSHLKHRHRFWRYAVRTERESISYIQSLDLKGTTVLDIGANRGVFTYWLSQCVGSSGNVVAFEAQPELKETIQEVQRLLYESIQYGLNNRQEALDYALQYGRDLDQDKADKFVGMYVNDRTLDFGPEGRESVARFLKMGFDQGILPELTVPEFVEF